MKKYAPVTIALMVISIFAATASAQIEPIEETDETVKTVEKVTDRDIICDSIRSGARIKIKVEAGPELNSKTNGLIDEFKGTVNSCDGGVLSFWAEGSNGGLTRVPLEHVQSMSFSDGKKGHAIMGAGIGLVFGVIAAVVTNADEDENSWEEFGNELVDETFDFLAPVGYALTGAVIGALIRTERWNTVWDEKTLISSVGKRNGQYLVAVGFEF